MENLNEETNAKNIEYWYRLLLKLATQEDIDKLKIAVRKKVTNNFIRPLRSQNRRYIKLLYEKDYYIPRESINLINQSYITLKNVDKLIKNKSLVDSNVLIRSSLEYFMMGVVISIDKNTYEEYKKIDIEDKDRKYTKIQTLINAFRKEFIKINSSLFLGISNTKLKKYFNEFYDKLCLFTHGSLIINQMVEGKINDDEDFFLVIAKQNMFFLELLFNHYLKYLTKGNFKSIDEKYILTGYILLFLNLDSNKYTSEYLQKYKNLLYIEINRDYIEKNNNEINEIQNEISEINNIIEKNPIKFIEIVKEILDLD